jgi:hypothetical protein
MRTLRISDKAKGRFTSDRRPRECCHDGRRNSWDILWSQWQPVAFVGVSHRNDVRLDARSGTRAVHGGGEAGNGKATYDADYSNVPGGPAPHTLRKNSSAIRIHL